ncbi:HisA/HisF-related TIM barrel protein [Candidatus Vidania fulgoroideorum]
MILIPALDFYKKKILRLKNGNFKKKFLFKNFKNVKKFFIKKSFKYVNLIDLEGAKKGKIKNFKIIGKFIKFFNKKKTKVNVGGGIRNTKSINFYLKKGANKIILSTKVIKNILFLKKINKKYGKKIIISLDIKKKYIMLEGWKKKYCSFKKYYKKIKNFYNGYIIVTNINSDGSNKGINKGFINYIIKITKNRKIIFSGGYKKKYFNFLLKKKIYAYISGRYIYKKI